MVRGRREGCGGGRENRRGGVRERGEVMKEEG